MERDIMVIDWKNQYYNSLPLSKLIYWYGTILIPFLFIYLFFDGGDWIPKFTWKKKKVRNSQDIPEEK